MNMVSYLKDYLSQTVQFLDIRFQCLIILYDVKLISLVFSVHHFTSCLTYCFRFISVFIYYVSFFNYIMVISVIFSVHRFTSPLTRFVNYIYILVEYFCHLYFSTHDCFISDYFFYKGNRFMFLCSFAMTTDEVDHQWSLCFNWWVLKFFML